MPSPDKSEPSTITRSRFVGGNYTRHEQSEFTCSAVHILGDPGAVSGGGKKSKRARKTDPGEFLTFIRPNFFVARLDFFPPPLTAPGSPRMCCTVRPTNIWFIF